MDLLKEIAIQAGFSRVGNINTDTLKVHASVRDICAENKCQHYGTNWACPPGCGTLDDCASLINKYHKGILVQSTVFREDSNDRTRIYELYAMHKMKFYLFSLEARKLFPNALFLGSGECQGCKVCTYPDYPCRFPDRLIPSMEAFGLRVSEVCELNHMKSSKDNNNLTFTCCVLV